MPRDPRQFARCRTPPVDGIEPLPWGARDYPPLLARIADPPPLLWVRGAAPLLSLPAVAVVGSRAASPYGLEVAHEFGAGLAETGVIVVSGLARGVDSSAHRGALTRGTTAAVFGSGADVIYPKEHAALAERIAERGVIVSELPPGAAAPPVSLPAPQPFDQRSLPRRRRRRSLHAQRIAPDRAPRPRTGPRGDGRARHRPRRPQPGLPRPAARRRGAGREGRRTSSTSFGCPGRSPRIHPGTNGRARPGCRCAAPDGLAPLESGEAFDFQQLLTITNLSAGVLLRQLLRAEMTGRVVRTGNGRFLRAGSPVVR